MTDSGKSTDGIDREKCIECGQAEEYIYDGRCFYCTDADDRAVNEFEEIFFHLTSEYDFATAFWSMDEAYNKFDGHQSLEEAMLDD
jgi:hypothetical protein